MLKDNPLQRESPYTCEEGQQQTVYALQEFFIGEWDDCAVMTNRLKAISDYGTFRHVHPRPTRLICRIETVLAQGKEIDERD